MPPGTVKTLRLLEGVPRRADDAAGAQAARPDAQANRIRPGPHWPRRLLAEVPVAPDGSFNVAVPANTPIELQLLDEHGVSLRSCGWLWTPNHFNQGCIGCHEDPGTDSRERDGPSPGKPVAACVSSRSGADIDRLPSRSDAHDRAEMPALSRYRRQRSQPGPRSTAADKCR